MSLTVEEVLGIVSEIDHEISQIDATLQNPQAIEEQIKEDVEALLSNFDVRGESGKDEKNKIKARYINILRSSRISGLKCARDRFEELRNLALRIIR